METFNFNLWLLQIIENYWSLFVILILLFIPVFPPAWFNYDDEYYYQNNNGVVYKKQKRLRITLLHAFIRLTVISVMTITDFLIYVITYFNFKETLSLVIAIAIGLDIYYKGGLTTESVVLVVVSLLVLYFEKLVDNGKRMGIMGKLFDWERNIQQSTTIVPPIPDSSSSSVVPTQENAKEIGKRVRKTKESTTTPKRRARKS